MTPDHSLSPLRLAALLSGLAPASLAPASLAAAPLAAAPLAAAPAVSLPAPSSAPQSITRAGDPFLAALAARDGTAAFDAGIVQGAAELPLLGERAEGITAAGAVSRQARSRLFPSLGVDLIAARTIDRDLQGSTTQVENLSPRQRNDVLGSADQLLYDFGATSARIRSSNETIEAARADLDTARNQALLQLIQTWYDVLEARTAVGLSGANVTRLAALADGAALRFQSGVDSGGDVARARSYLAAAQSQQANFERQRATAEARYIEIFNAAPTAVARPETPVPVAPVAPGERPELAAARAQERAAAAAVDAAKSDRLPRLGARVGTNAYNVVSGDTPAYDIRGTFTLSQRFSVGGAEAARVSELKARRRAAGYAIDRIEAATLRERATAEADVLGLAASLPPLEAAYLDSRRARDLFVEQFRVSRGTLFDVLRAERDLLEAALGLARTSYALDIARFTLLARQNGLIPRFGIAPAASVDVPRENK